MNNAEKFLKSGTKEEFMKEFRKFVEPEGDYELTSDEALEIIIGQEA